MVAEYSEFTFSKFTAFMLSADFFCFYFRTANGETVPISHIIRAYRRRTSRNSAAPIGKAFNRERISPLTSGANF